MCIPQFLNPDLSEVKLGDGTLKKVFILLSILLVSTAYFLFDSVTVEASSNSPTVYVKIHRIQKVDDIEGFLEGEADWRFFIWVWDGKEWLSVEETVERNRDDALIDKTYTFTVKTTLTYIHIALVDDDTLTLWDLADISSYPGGGIDNWEGGRVPRAAEYQGTYNLKTNLLTGDQVIAEGGYYKTSGDYDGSVDVDENDANIWFMVWDNYDPPKADAGPDQRVKTGDKVNFDGTNSRASEGSSIVRYEWDFESDGKFDAEGMRTSYSYARKGVYTVTLRVTDDLGESDTDTCIVVVENRPPTASFTYSPSNPTIRDTISFYDTSTDLDGSVVSWYWDFGDGATSTERNPIHKYSDKGSFIVRLTVTDNDGDKDSTTKIVTIVNLPPTADFAYSPSEPVENQEIQFTDRSSDPEGKLVSWSWDFGDGYRSTSQNPTHKYIKAGTYMVTLTVTDDEGVSSTKSITITVLTPPFWTQAWFYGLVLGAICITLAVIIMVKRRPMPKTVEKPN